MKNEELIEQSKELVKRKRNRPDLIIDNPLICQKCGKEMNVSASAPLLHGIWVNADCECGYEAYGYAIRGKTEDDDRIYIWSASKQRFLTD